MRVFALAVALIGCRAEEPGVLSADPPSGSLSGYYPVRLDLTEAGVAAGDVTDVRVGGVRAWQVQVEGADLVVQVQGAPEPGPQEIVLQTASGPRSFPAAFTYDPPLDPLFDRVVAMGASLTQGVQGGVPIQHGNLHSPPHLLAQQTGAYMPLPLLVDPLFPTIEWDDIGAAPACTIPDVVQHIAYAALDVLTILNDPEADTIAFHKARVDPELRIHNVAVGDTQLAALVHGPPDDPAELFVVKMVYAPYAQLLEPVTTAQIELVEDLEPTLVMITDTYGNDLIKSILEGGIDPERLTDPEDIRADLEELSSRLSATGAESFLANMPRPTVLPATADKRAQRIAEGEDPASVDGRIAEIEAAGALYNDILDEVAAGYDNVHVVDFGGAVADIEANGLAVGDETLTVEKFGGVLSTDGVHLGDVGYGLMADLFVETINRELGTDVPRVDLAALLPDDPYGSAGMAAAGFDPTRCDR